MKRTFLLFISLFIGKIAFALPGYWDTGYGQGIAEYTLENKDGRKIVVSCNDSGLDYMDHSVDIYMKGHDGPIVSDEEEHPPLEFLIDGDTYYAPYETRSRSGSNDWYQLTDALSKASSFKFFWNGEFFGDFESKNTGKTIANLKNCKAMVDRNFELDEGNNTAFNNNSTQFVEYEDLAPMSTNPFKVTVEYVPPGFSGAQFMITALSLEDAITVKNITVNRGNCEVNGYLPPVPVRRGYSDPVRAYVSTYCDVLEIKISTNKGDVIYNL